MPLKQGKPTLGQGMEEGEPHSQHLCIFNRRFELIENSPSLLLVLWASAKGKSANIKKGKKLKPMKWRNNKEVNHLKGKKHF